MYRVLHISSKYCDSYIPHGLSNTLHNIDGSINCSGLAQCKLFCYDEYYFENKVPGDKAILDLCTKYNFDFVLIDGYNGTVEETTSSDPEKHMISEKTNRSFKPKGHTWLNPSLETLTILKNDFKLPLISIWYDSVYRMNIELAEFLSDYVDFSIVLDSSFLHYCVRDPTRYLTLWTPQDPHLYYDIGEENKDIPISFIGRLNKSRTGRKTRLKYLRDNGIKVFHSGGQREKTALSITQYADYIRRSKIGLSFPKSRSTISQITGRTFEIILSGSMLLEELNLETLRFFTPMVDYIPFYGLDDLWAKARYFMYFNDERMAIAENGRKKAEQYYSNTKFWQIVIDKLKQDNAL